jgi:tetratricopeptide (TPR) repeat protein
VDINKAETFDRSWEANHYAGLGSCYLELGQFARAENCYEQDLEIRREIVDRSGEVSALMGLASCYRSMGRTSNAMELYEQALSISREIERSSEEVRIVGNLGSCYSNLGQVEQAINYYQQALDDARKIKRPKLEGLQLRNFADLFSYEGRYVEAIQFALKSQNIGEDLSSPYAGSHSNTYLAQAYLFSGDLNAARSAIEAAQQFDIPSNNYKVSALMGIIALRQGDKLKAQESFESTLQQIQVRLGHCADNYYALDIKGLVLCGLSLCTSTNQLVLAADTFKLARGINKEVGVVKRILCLFDALAHNSEDALAEVRTIAAAH